MSLIKKSDVKNHLSARHQNRIHIAPVSQPDATGFSGTHEAPAGTGGSVFNRDFTGDHTTSETAVAPTPESSVTPQSQVSAGFGAAKP